MGVETIRRAHAVHPITDLQIEYSLISRGIEEAILPTCRELGIAVTAYGVLARGLIGGHWRPEAAAPNDHRAFTPRFQGENLDRNLALVEALREAAGAQGMSVAQAAIGWVLAQGRDIIPLIGARRRERLEEALGSLEVTLSDTDLAAIEAAMPESAAAGLRYPDAQMAFLDSERRTS
jgi:aryl-alcohol dehydrogenase-like predicted oxidoreductase